MRHGLPLLAFVLAVAAGMVHAQTDPLEEAMTVFRDGRVIVEYSDHGRARLESAIAAFKDALDVPVSLEELDEDAVDAFPIGVEWRPQVTRLSQCYFTLATVFLKGEEGEEDAYRKGKHWGLKSLRMDPAFARLEDEDGFVSAVEHETDVESLYWACMNWVGVANFDRLAAIPAGIVRKTVAMLERCAELDPTYDCYGPYRILGSIWGALPRLPFGTYRKNLERARSYLCRVVDDPALCADLSLPPVDPVCTAYLGNRRVLAEFYLMERRMWQEAERVLRSVLEEPIGETYPLYNARAQDDARALLEEVRDHL
jgi:hypothetical protein